ncbi:MAG: YhbY family RNA-binding protein [Candidatus Bathyarchaeota archaeon]|nr:MAG: YhbY family RNA-binding protein [Candidatus Bathyarchaeota archaeon]
MLTPRMKRIIKRKLSVERPKVWIGKNGVSQKVLAEVDGWLERVEMVKVKIQKGALEEYSAKEISNKIAHQTGSFLVEVRGHTFILYRKKTKTES